MRRISWLWFLTCCTLLLAGCKEAIPADDTISIDKEGNITCTIVEDFDKDFYDAEELKQTIDEDIADYNVNFGQDHLSLKSFQVENGVAVLQILFDGARYYADYSGVTFFIGTVAEALGEGYDLSGECMGADGALTDLGSIEDAGELKVVILEEAVSVRVPGNIVCASRAGNVAINDKKEAAVKEAGEAFIVYK